MASVKASPKREIQLKNAKPKNIWKKVGDCGELWGKICTFVTQIFI
ncbi:MAG: hypothetical protein IKT00_11895 [Prevotella sp.]|nr:hypothetical protein [Prevotella sp.]